MAGSGLVLGAHRIELAGRLGGAAAPVGGARAHDRIGRVLVDTGEMLERGRRIGEEAQRDPAGHEMEFGPVIGIGRGRGLAHDPIGGLRGAEIEELAGEHPTLAPPFIGVLTLQILARSREHQLDRGRDAVVPQQPVKAAQGVAQLPACLGGNRVEQFPALGGVRLGGGASLDDRDFVVAEALGRAHRGAEVLGADAPVHAGGVIGAGQEVAERVEHRGFRFGRQRRRAAPATASPRRAGAAAECSASRDWRG